VTKAAASATVAGVVRQSCRKLRSVPRPSKWRAVKAAAHLVLHTPPLH